MSKPIDPPKCAYPGCGQPHEVDRIACAKHREPCEPWGVAVREFTTVLDNVRPIRGKR